MSDDYARVSTPSTADVREYFAFGDFHAWSERVPERYELFDAWLAEHDRQVAERVHDETVQVMDGLMPRGRTYDVAVNPYRVKG
jgi:hypothetical protein